MSFLRRRKKTAVPESAITLVIIYNHYHPQNIDKIEALYSSQFRSIFHVMPFAMRENRTRENVIPVFESSHFFQGYIAQVAHKLPPTKKYLFLADDALLNPLVNETNYPELLGLNSGNFITALKGLGDGKNFWQWAEGATEWRARAPGVVVPSLLPSKADATARFNEHNLANFLEVPATVLTRTPGGSEEPKPLGYPLARGWSDVLVVDRKSLEDFSIFCGIFAATNLFVEVAIPTALVLSSPDPIDTAKSGHFRPRAVWTSEEKSHLASFTNRESLFRDLPPQTFCIHPVKLSGWSAP